jgi:hypothetical protein
VASSPPPLAIAAIDALSLVNMRSREDREAMIV